MNAPQELILDYAKSNSLIKRVKSLNHQFGSSPNIIYNCNKLFDYLQNSIPT